MSQWNYFGVGARGEAFDVDAFLASTTLRPDYSWRRGELKRYTCIRSRNKLSGVHFELGDGPTLSLEEQDRIAVSYLEAHRDELRALARFPGVDRFSLCLHYHETFESSVSGVIIGPSPRLVRCCHETGCELDFYVSLYRKPESESEDAEPDERSHLGADMTTLAVIRALLNRYRVEGLEPAESRRRILDELRAALPAEAVEDYDLETIVARWQRAIEEATQ